jgi:hypothetical protein
MAELSLPFGVYRATRGDLDLKFRVADDAARDALIDPQDLVEVGHIIYHEVDDKHYKLKTYPTFGDLTGVEWEEFGGSTDLPIISVDQGNGVGYVISGRDETKFGNVGEHSFDFSDTFDTTGVMGATGGWSFATGYDNKATGDVSAAFGRGNESRGFSSATYGTFNLASGNFSFAAGVSGVASDWYSVTIGQALLSKTTATCVFGQANTDYDTTGMSLNSGTKPVFIVGNGDTTQTGDGFSYGHGAVTRSDALIVYKSGKIIAPSLDISLITDDKDLTTKEYVESLQGEFELKTDSTTSITLSSADKGKVISADSSSAITFTINTTSLTDIGDIAYVDQMGSGEVTFVASGVTLQYNASRLLKTDGQFSRVAIHKTGATTYRVFGELAQDFS